MAVDSRTVLNVHGDGGTRATVARLLDAEGLRTRDVASAAEARVALFQSRERDAGLILLDAQLDGAEALCRSLRERAEATPPLILTCPAAAGPAEHLSTLADDVLERPPDPLRWASTIRAWVRVGDRYRAQQTEATLWRSIFEAVEEGVALIGPDGAIRCCNAALAGLLGEESPTALVGQMLADRAVHLKPAGLPWPVERTLRGGGRSRDEWELGRRWLRSTSAPVRDARGVLNGAVVTIEDVTTEVQLRRRIAEVEAEAQSRDERIEQLERDARLYQSLAGLELRSGEPGEPPPSLSQALPEAFCDAVEDYCRVLDLRLRRRGYHLDDNKNDGSTELTALAERLGDAGAGPRDVVELHALALRQRATGSQSARARVYAEESQVAILELMGRLAEHYRAGRNAVARPGLVAPDRSPSIPE